MDLFKILNKILRTKNQIRDILGENNNFARYYVTIHNKLADQYNSGWRNGFYDKYLDITGVEKYPKVPKDPLPYDYYVNPKYYEAYTPSVLADIMEDVLNYRLQIKDELNDYLDPDIEDNFEDYPGYLNTLLGVVKTLGYNKGIEDAAAAAAQDEEIIIPTYAYEDNRFYIYSSQPGSLVYYKLGENGVPFLYDGAFILSEEVDVYYWVKLGNGSTERNPVIFHCTISENGNHAYVFPPDIIQNEDRIYLKCTTSGATIMYSIDNGQWNIYSGAIVVKEGMSNIKVFATSNNEFSKYNSQVISHDTGEVSRPEMVQCTVEELGYTRRITLTCPTPDVAIRWAFDENDGYNRTYNGPWEVTETYFVLYTYAENPLVFDKPSIKRIYTYGKPDDSSVPANVQFADGGSSITLYTVTSGAKISYRLSRVGAYTDTEYNSITLSPSARTDIYAYCTLDDVPCSAVTHYLFVPAGTTMKPPKPEMIQSGNKVNIVSDYEVRYSKGANSDPVNGIVYNPDLGVVIDEPTIVINAVAVNNGLYSDPKTGSFNYVEDAQGGPSGSTGGGQGNGTSTDEPFDSTKNWFAVQGVTDINFVGTLYYCYGTGNWNKANGTKVSGLDSSRKIYLKGNVSRFTSFIGNASITGDISSVVAGDTGIWDLKYTNMFNGCSGLKYANIYIPISDMPANMMEGMFANCTSLVTAGFDISGNAVSNYGMQNMFKGCTNLTAGPSFNFSVVGSSGMKSCFENCSNLAVVGNMNLTKIGAGAFESCFKNTAIRSFSMVTPSGPEAAPTNAFKSMFEVCVQLTDVSNIQMNYTVMGSSTCERMFYGCQRLTRTFPLYANKLNTASYMQMFEGCSSLDNTEQNPIIMNATQLASDCCNRMFYGCTSLTVSPELNAVSISGCTHCYADMFNGCTSLQQITAMFVKDPSSGEHTANSGISSGWVNNVYPTGTFIANREATWPNNAPRGIKTIPVGWGVSTQAVTNSISEIYARNGMIHITKVGDGTIYYKYMPTKITDTSQYDEYTGPFQGVAGWWVSAAVMNEDGVFGDPTYKQFTDADLNYPEIIITKRDGYLKIGVDKYADFVYDSYDFTVYTNSGKTNLIQPKTVYTSDSQYAITQNCYVVVNGYYGSYTKTQEKALNASVTGPAIEFYIAHEDNVQAARYWFALSYPGAGLVKLYYKYNNTVDDTPDDSDLWVEYPGDQVQINNSYIDPVNGYVTVTAIAKVTLNGVTQWSDINSASMTKNSSENILTPVMKQISGSNDVICEYGGQEYRTWTLTDTKVYYSFIENAWSSAKEYTGIFNLSEAGYSAAHDVTVWAGVRVGNVRDRYMTGYPMRFDPGNVHFTILDPDTPIAKLDSDGKIRIYITNQTPDPNWMSYRPQTYFKINVTQRIDTSEPINSLPYSGYMYYEQPFVVEYNFYKIKKFTVSAYTVLYNDSTEDNTVYSIEYDFSDAFYTRPVADISIGQDHKVTITYPFDNVTPYVKITTTSDSWGPGVTNKDKYNELGWVPAGNTTIGLGEVSSPAGQTIYAGYLDDKLATATIYAKYEYDGIPSEETSQAYNNSDVSPMVAPSINYEWIDRKKAYILKLTNTQNSGVQLKFKIVTTTDDWAGGVLDGQRHKYDTYRLCGTAGETLDPYLKHGFIYALTTDGETSVESEPYEFINEHYTSLPDPQINITEDNRNTNYAVKVSNDNKLATNHWRCVDQNWLIPPLSPKYTWMIASNTFDDIDDNLISGTIQAYSEWGTETSNIVEYNYDTGITLNVTPPSIIVGDPDQNDTITVTITSNADFSNFKFVLWMIDDIYWNDTEDVDCFYGLYQYTQYGLKWKLQNLTSSNTFTFTIGRDVKSGTIKALSTHDGDHRSEGTLKTPVTIVDFVNPMLQ